MIVELLALYQKFLIDLAEWNKNKSPIEEEKDPTFELFMNWLIDYHNRK